MTTGLSNPAVREYLRVVALEYALFRQESGEWLEQYKFEALPSLNQQLDVAGISAENIGKIVETLRKGNPQRGTFVHFTNIVDLTNLAAKEPQLTAELLRGLFDESRPLAARIEAFRDRARQVMPEIRLGTPLFGYIMAAFDMVRYPLYKDETFRRITSLLGIESKSEVADKYAQFTELARHCAESFLKDHFENPTAADGQDFLYCVTFYPYLRFRASSRYLLGLSKKLAEFKKEPEAFLEVVCKLDRDYLEEQLAHYRGKEKVGQIRFRLVQSILERGEVTLSDFQQIKDEVNSEYGTNILQGWSDFSLLFPIYYEQHKRLTGALLGEIEEVLTKHEKLDSLAPLESKTSDFMYNWNFGTDRCWIALYPADKPSHKDAAQLFLGFDSGQVWFGLNLGSNFQASHPGVAKDLEGETNIDHVTLDRVVDRFVQVGDRFRELNQLGRPVGTPQITSSALSVDFEAPIDLRGLYFPDAPRLKDQIAAALRAGKHIILTGPPGSGKTKLARNICRSMVGTNFVLATANSDWSTYDTIGGYRPRADGTLEFRPGIFLECFKRGNSPDNRWLIVDEMNRADIDKAFGAFFSVLTGDPVTLGFEAANGKNVVILPWDHRTDPKELAEHEYVVPRDWRMIATINTYDKSALYEMSYALMRRFAFVPVDIPENIDHRLVEEYLRVWLESEPDAGELDEAELAGQLADLWKVVNEYRPIGPAVIKDICSYVRQGRPYSEALVMYVLPQFEGLPDNKIKEFYKDVRGLYFLDEGRGLLRFIEDFFGTRVS